MIKPGCFGGRHFVLSSLLRTGLSALVVGLAACSKSVGPNSGSMPPSLTPQAPRVAGTINGGGGAGLRCNGKLEVLDLFEARKQGMKLVAAPTTAADAITLVAVRIANHFWNPETIALPDYTKALAEHLIQPIMEGRPFKNHATDAFEEVHFVDSLPLSNDFGHYEVPAGCAIEQIAYFSDTSTKLSIVRSAWAELDFFSKAVLIAHELFYMNNRREGLETLRGETARTSEFTRRFVGRLFASNPLPSKSDSLPTDGSLRRCSTENSTESSNDKPTFFYTYQSADSKRTTFVFKTVLGHSSPYLLRTDLNRGKSEGKVSAVGAMAPKDDSLITVQVLKQVGQEPTMEFKTFSGKSSRSLSPPQRFRCERL